MSTPTRLVITTLCIAVVSMLFIDFASAQSRGRIAGRVTDTTGESLIGVNVLVMETTQGTVTDAAGNYSIGNLLPGTYSVRFGYVGFREVIVTDVNVQSDRTAELDIRLEEAVVEGEEVVITASRPLVETGNTTSLVRLESQELLARPTSELSTVLTSLPSVNFENGQMTIRGGGLSQVAVLVDGARVRNPLDHSAFTRVNLGAIEELEVITGTFNAEYGEAQSGVVNVITKEGNDRYELYGDFRYRPPGVPHWGVSLYDRGTDLYWENANARHLEWWIEYPDMWVDPNGFRGTDPRSTWTAEQAYQNYLQMTEPLTDYTNTPSYHAEVGLGGPVPLINDLYFFGTFSRRQQAPIMGNAYRDRGYFHDGTLRLTYRVPGAGRLSFSGFRSQDEAGWGFWNDTWWAQNYGIDSRYAFYDWAGYPYSETNGLTLRYSHVIDNASMWEARISRVQALRRQVPFPDDPLGWDASDATRDFLRARDASGNQIPGGFSNRVGFNTTGYYMMFDGDNVEYNVDAFYSNQLNHYVHLKTGANFNYYILDHYNRSKFPDRVDQRTYRPYQGATYAQSRIEIGGMIMNAGLRFDFYNNNDTVYVDLFNPLGGETEATSTFWQISPRLGISHPIDAKTKLHFSYGHFFQRPSYGDYGEGNAFVSGSLTTYLIEGTQIPWVLGNRNLRPTKTISYEVGIERNFWEHFVVDLTGYYKDRRNTIRTITIDTPNGQYRTTGNGDYSDERGVEFSIRKVPSQTRWGSIWGYANYSTRLSIFGRSGAPTFLSPTEQRPSPSGDDLHFNNPIFKAGLYYQTPPGRGLRGSLLGDWSVSFDYRAIFPHDQLQGDYIVVDGAKAVRPVDQNLDLRARKEFALVRGASISPYIEVQNVLNQKWVNLGMMQAVSDDDRRRLVESGWSDVPTHDTNGRPILDLAKYRNLPRQVYLGFTFEF
jgi:outer membrane receptor protein involved in Fe transport